jgi:CheY-like chemotaxis protein
VSLGKTVLVVDDDETIRELIEWVLGDEGYEVLVADNGASALTTLEQLRPDLILLDLRMPVMDGAKFVEAYRKLPTRGAPIVVMTAGRGGGDLVSAGSAVGRLDKPFEIEDLIAVANHYAPLAGPARAPNSRPFVAVDDADTGRDEQDVRALFDLTKN